MHKLPPDTEMEGAQSLVLPTSVQTPHSVLLQLGLPDVQVLPKLGIQSSFMTAQEGVQASNAHLRLSTSSPSMAYGPCFHAKPNETASASSLTSERLRGGVYGPSTPALKRKQAPIAPWTSTKFVSGMHCFDSPALNFAFPLSRCSCACAYGCLGVCAFAFARACVCILSLSLSPSLSLSL